jgi:type II secretory pathway component PulK
MTPLDQATCAAAAPLDGATHGSIRTITRRYRIGNRRGFALIAVLLVLAVVGVIGAEFAYSMRLEATSVRSFKDTLIGAHLAEAAVEQAIREIAGDVAFVATDDDGALTFYTRDRVALKRLPRTNVPLGVGQFTYRVTDEESRLNLNAATPDRVDRLLQALGVDKIERDTINDSLQDWRDANEEHRLNGAESDEYLQRLLPYRSKNAALDSITELLQVKGMTPAIFQGTAGKPGLAAYVTVKSPGQVNVNTAPCIVLKALGLGDAECTAVDQARRDGPYTTVPGQFGGRGLSTTSRTFRIEAEGLVGGEVRARLTAIVQRRADAASDSIAVLEWSGVR